MLTVKQITMMLKVSQARRLVAAGLLGICLFVTVLAQAQDKNVPAQVLFPGQAEPRISADVLKAFDLTLSRDYQGALAVMKALSRDLPDNPTGPAAEMVIYQVMMLENDDYEYDAPFREAAHRAETAAAGFAEHAPKNEWYCTLLGASWGIEGIYFLRRSEYMTAFPKGLRAMYYMQAAAQMSPENYEARLGMGVFIYYRSAYAQALGLSWLNQRQRGEAMVRESGEKRAYLAEISRIALHYIFIDEKRYDDALALAQGLIHDRPHFPFFYSLAGRAYADRNDFANAYPYYREMHTVAPDLYLPDFRLAECSLRMGRKAEAKSWLDEFFRVLGNRESQYRKTAEQYLKEAES
jgi:hypothetical protein